MDLGECCGRERTPWGDGGGISGLGDGPAAWGGVCGPVPPGRGLREQPGPVREGATVYRAFAYF